MNIKSFTKKLLYSYNVTSYQRSFSVTIPDDYKYILIHYTGYVGESIAYYILIDTSVNNRYACMAEWGTQNGFPFRGRNASYTVSNRRLSIGTGYRYDPYGNPEGWYYDDRICPVCEIFGIN